MCVLAVSNVEDYRAVDPEGEVNTASYGSFTRPSSPVLLLLLFFHLLARPSYSNRSLLPLHRCFYAQEIGVTEVFGRNCGVVYFGRSLLLPCCLGRALNYCSCCGEKKKKKPFQISASIIVSSFTESRMLTLLEPNQKAPRPRSVGCLTGRQAPSTRFLGAGNSSQSTLRLIFVLLRLQQLITE